MCFLQIIKSSKAIVFTIPSCPQKIKNFYNPNASRWGFASLFSDKSKMSEQNNLY